MAAMHATAVKGSWDAAGSMIRAITVTICAIIACQRRSPLASECRAAKYQTSGFFLQRGTDQALRSRLPRCAMGFAPKVSFAVDSPLEGGVYCEPVSEVGLPAPGE